MNHPMLRGEIWLVRLDPTIGSEIAKTRPGVIINNDDIGILPLKIIVPVTDWKDRYANLPWMVKISQLPESGLIKESVADCFQIRSIAQVRFLNKLGKVSNAEIQQITNALSIVLKL